MKIKFIALAVVIFANTCLRAFAGEGMWLPLLLQQLNEKEMHDMGMRITADDLYSINHSSLKDAIVLFGGGCTAELVSDRGLLLTNHHCGLGNIQKHSSLDHDYVSNGFWATSFGEELPNPGLSVTFLVRMEDVTSRVLAGIHADMTTVSRDQMIKTNIRQVEKDASSDPQYNASVKAFYAGNQYYLFITQTFSDVRLVGAPPSSIGKFGGDTDNWMWPRHTGDFSVFRIYASKDNKPAPYSKDNVPYKPARHFTISLKGISEGDFTFVYGYPGTTQEYLSSYGVNLQVNVRNPIAINLRQQRLDIINRAMEQDRLTKIQYIAKAAGIANGWKKMIGESRGIQNLHGIEKKQLFESQFTEWTQNDALRNIQYGKLLPVFNETYSTAIPLVKANTYINEGLLGVELLRFANGYSNLVKNCADKTKPDSDIANQVKQLMASAKQFYENYNLKIDRQIFESMMNEYLKSCDPVLQVSYVKQQASKYKMNTGKWAEAIFSHSVFADSVKLNRMLSGFNRSNAKYLLKDPAFILSREIVQYQQNAIAPTLSGIYAKVDSLQRIYMAAQLEMEPGKRFYPDANSTLRVAYGKVQGYDPADAIHYRWFTTLDGVIQKEDPAIDDYAVDPELKKLYLSKDFGRYADADGKMHVAFIASNHTTGGNSGSPVLNADGQLIGINFDRCWEGTMSDLMYDPAQCRNISLDIRYCLFVIDKMAHAQRLIDEMSIAM